MLWEYHTLLQWFLIPKIRSVHLPRAYNFAQYEYITCCMYCSTECLQQCIGEYMSPPPPRCRLTGEIFKVSKPPVFCTLNGQEHFSVQLLGAATTKVLLLKGVIKTFIVDNIGKSSCYILGSIYDICRSSVHLRKWWWSISIQTVPTYITSNKVSIEFSKLASNMLYI